MRVDVVMPQMGESIAEGTITRWLKQVGDQVERDEPLYEISTDKVDAEIPSPQAGTLVEIKSAEGATVPVNAVVAVLDTEAGAAAAAGKAESSGAAKAPAAAAPAAKPATDKPTAATASAPASRAASDTASGTASDAGSDAESTDRAFFSPVVRKIAAEHGIDPGRVAGTGVGGRVTKQDILAFVASGASGPAGKPASGSASPAAQSAATSAPLPEPSRPRSTPRVGPAPVRFAAGERTVRETMSVMRRKIAEHMVASRRTSAHVQSLFEVDMTHVGRLRQKYKPSYAERHGVNLTYMPFVIRAVAAGLRDWPVINASIEDDTVVYKKDLNIGIAVALDWGLIVPVVRNADELSLAGLAKRVTDLGLRARNKQLNPDEVQGGTFTITNPGQFGGLFGLPIINQPQVAILGMGGIQKRPVVIDDAIAIRSMMYVSMSYDHRVVDGAVADQFLAGLQAFLEDFDESLV